MDIEDEKLDIENEQSLDVFQVLDVLRRQMSGVFRVQLKQEFLVHRNLKSGDVQKVTVEILDAGPHANPERRFKCIARTEDGKTASGNSARTIETTLALVHWTDLD